MKKFVFGIVLAFLIVSQAVMAQKPFKVGIVDVSVIAKEMPEAKEADDRLKKLTVQYRDLLMKMEQNLQERYQQYEKQKAMMTPDQVKKEEDALRAIQQQGLQFQEEKLGMNGEVATMRDNLLAPIREKIQKAIAEVSKDESINLVLDKTSSAVLFSEDKMDITYKVLDMLKRGKGQ